MIQGNKYYKFVRIIVLALMASSMCVACGKDKTSQENQSVQETDNVSQAQDEAGNDDQEVKESPSEAVDNEQETSNEEADTKDENEQASDGGEDYGSMDLLFNNVGSDAIELEGAAIEQGSTQNMSVDVDGDGTPEQFSIERDDPNGTKVMGIKDGKGQNFIGDIKDIDAVDEYGQIKEGYFVEISCADLDGDSKKEVIVSVGDHLIEMETLIYKIKQEASDTPYQLMGTIQGQEYMYLDKECNIIAPYGSQGLFETYCYTGNEVRKAD